MSDILIFDTSVLVDDLRTGCHRDRIATIRGLIRNSSVVLAELWRGASKLAEREFLRTLAENHPILTPTERNWLQSGRILADIRSEHRLNAEKLRDLHFDVLIALTARACGARLITSNRADFEIIRRHSKFQLEIW
jgi:predicted nucleic acid-binding protein